MLVLALLLIALSVRIGIFIGVYGLRRGDVPTWFVILAVISNIVLLVIEQMTDMLRGQYYATEHLDSSQSLRPRIARFSKIRALLWLFHIILFLWALSGI